MFDFVVCLGVGQRTARDSMRRNMGTVSFLFDAFNYNERGEYLNLCVSISNEDLTTIIAFEYQQRWS